MVDNPYCHCAHLSFCDLYIYKLWLSASMSYYDLGNGGPMLSLLPVRLLTSELAITVATSQVKPQRMHDSCSSSLAIVPSLDTNYRLFIPWYVSGSSRKRPLPDFRH